MTYKELWIGGALMSDQIWEDLVKLEHLRLLELAGLSVFTPRGIMQFIESLDHGRNMQLAIMAAHAPLPEPEKDELEQEMSKRGGSFMYTPWRGENVTRFGHNGLR